MRFCLLLCICVLVQAADVPQSTSAEGMLPGLLLQVYKGAEWKRLPDLQKHEPLSTSVVDKVGLAKEHRKDHIALRFSGYLFVRKTDEYVFGTESDDGSTLWLGGKKIIDNDGLHGAQTRKTKVLLERGLYPIVINWYNGVHAPTLRAWWTGSRQSQMAIGGDDIYHLATVDERKQDQRCLGMADLGLADKKEPPPSVLPGTDGRTPTTIREPVVVEPKFDALEIGLLTGLILGLVLFVLWRMMRRDAEDLDRLADDLDRRRKRRRH